MSKVCTKCGENKALSEFHRNSSATDGLQLWCKPCVLAQTRTKGGRAIQRRANNTEASKARMRAL